MSELPQTIENIHVVNVAKQVGFSIERCNDLQSTLKEIRKIIDSNLFETFDKYMDSREGTLNYVLLGYDYGRGYVQISDKYINFYLPYNSSYYPTIDGHNNPDLTVEFKYPTPLCYPVADYDFTEEAGGLEGVSFLYSSTNKQPLPYKYELSGGAWDHKWTPMTEMGGKEPTWTNSSLGYIHFTNAFAPNQLGRLNFTLNLTGMGNDPCKRCCSCEIEEKKYKTVIEFTADEPLQDKVTITPPELEYEWQGNNLILMLAEGETVTVDNIPAGVEYLISVESDDPCDENEYLIDNASGIIGEDSEGNPQEETEVNIEAQTGETVEQYLDRLRQRGYEALAESLKLENVEFTLQDERVKLGDLVTVDMPEFDFKAVVRVTGVKLKSQDNQTIRTISVGTPLKILRKPRI